jgi:hypothetical protein
MEKKKLDIFFLLHYNEKAKMDLFLDGEQFTRTIHPSRTNKHGIKNYRTLLKVVFSKSESNCTLGTCHF